VRPRGWTMIKETPSIGRLVAMVVFALSCFGLLLFLWLAFGGPVPLKPEGYRFKVRVPEAATLPVEVDVRLAGVNIGKVKKKELDKRGARTIVEVELEEKYAPIPKNSKAMLRQKTLLGETYVEITPGNRSGGMLGDGDTLPNSQVAKTVELDEIFTSFDKAIGPASPRRSEDLNSAFGNLEGFAVDGATLLKTLDEQRVAVRRLIRNTGQVFGALNERQGALRELIVNSNNTFDALASRQRALAETFQIFPTFLDESKATAARLERFARNTRPFVNTLKGPARNLGPTVRDLGDLAPDLEKLFRDLRPLIRASRTGLPDLERVLRGLGPFVDGVHTFFPELNPILSYLNFHQTTVAGFLQNGVPDILGDAGGQHYQTQVALIDSRSFQRFTTRQPWERGNAYMAPNALQRSIALGTIESFDCKARGGERSDPIDQSTPGGEPRQPPCFVQPGSLWNGKQFVKPGKGEAPNRKAPGFRDGNRPAVDPNPGDPLK
jgi:phospholipid/cholesterol/gamma-HCH transport system substrate-binding protein